MRRFITDLSNFIDAEFPYPYPAVSIAAELCISSPPSVVMSARALAVRRLKGRLNCRTSNYSRKGEYKNDDRRDWRTNVVFCSIK